MKYKDIDSFARDVQFVVPVYKAAWNETPAIRSLEQTGAKYGIKLNVAVFDNSPQPSSDVVPLKFVKAKYAHNGANLGVSQCYNNGFSLAKKNNRQWLLLLDHDFEFSPEMLLRYVTAVNKHQDAQLFCPKLVSNGLQLSPCVERWGRGRPAKPMAAGMYPLGKNLILNCGVLISSAAFEALGGYSAAIPLDFSDMYFTKSFGRRYKSFALIDVEAQHDFSGFQTMSCEAALERFGFYCTGARNLCREFGGLPAASFWTLGRAAKLAWRFKRSAFLGLFWRNFALAKSVQTTARTT